MADIYDVKIIQALYMMEQQFRRIDFNSPVKVELKCSGKNIYLGRLNDPNSVAVFFLKTAFDYTGFRQDADLSCGTISLDKMTPDGARSFIRKILDYMSLLTLAEGDYENLDAIRDEIEDIVRFSGIEVCYSRI